MAVIAVIITAPLGAILTNTLGVKWLSHDEDFDPVKTYADEGTKMGASMRRPAGSEAINGKATSGTGPDIEMNQVADGDEFKDSERNANNSIPDEAAAIEALPQTRTAGN